MPVSPNYGSMNIDNISDQIWMVHIPSKLTREWDSAKEGTILRELTFTMGTNVAKKLEGNANNNKNASQ